MSVAKCIWSLLWFSKSLQGAKVQFYIVCKWKRILRVLKFQKFGLLKMANVKKNIVSAKCGDKLVHYWIYHLFRNELVNLFKIF